jgi:hypothetical protein
MSVTPSAALFYPYTDIRDEAWLRSAILFWDSLRTIVPYQSRSPYSNALTSVLHDEGILQPLHVSPDDDEVEALTDAVLEYLTDPASVDIFPDRTEHDAFAGELFEIHPAKLPYIIQGHFRSALNDKSRMRVPRAFANFYMTLLATKLADRLGLSLVTDLSAADHLAVSVQRDKRSRTDHRLGRPNRHRRAHEHLGLRTAFPIEAGPGLLVDLVLQGIKLPPDIDIRQIIKFKSDHADELSVFRREMTRLASEIPAGLPVEALRQKVHDQYVGQILPALNSLRKSLQAQRWDSALNGLLKVSFFSVGSGSAAVLAGIPGPVALIAGAGISAAATAVMLRNQQQQAKRNSPYAYLLALNKRW